MNSIKICYRLILDISRFLIGSKEERENSNEMMVIVEARITKIYTF